MPTLRDQAAIVGIGETEFSANSGRSELTLACEAIKGAAADAGIPVHDIDGMVRSNSDSNTEVALISALGLPNLSYFGEIGYGGSGAAALVGHAAAAITLGLARVVVCFRAMNERSGRRFGLSAAPSKVGGTLAFEAPYGMLVAAHRFGMFARRHMLEYGTTSRQFGMVAVTQREHALRNPRAMMYGRPLSIEDHQNSRLICDPLHLYDCCLESDGAVAFIVTSAHRAKDLRQRPVLIMGAAQASGPEADAIVYRPSLSLSEAEYAAKGVYAMAGLSPADIDVAEFYDHFSPFVLFALEAFGFCERGEAGALVESGYTAWPDGRLPVNTHGGNLSEAYIHGVTHVLEGVRQLRGTSTCQVPDAEVALVGSAVAQLSSAVILRR